MKKGWQTKTIGEVCDLATGGTPSRAKPEYFGGDIKWLVSGDINQGEIFDCEGRITEAGKKNSNAKFLPINSVMIALNGQGKTRGTVAMLRTQATCNQSMVSISPKQSSGLLPEFLYANLHGRYEEIRRMTSDDDKDRRGLNMGLIRSIKIPIAPLTEQKRIVDLLDEVFEDIATAKTNSEKNLQNARALFESRLQSVFTQCGKSVRAGWHKTKLTELADVQSGSGFPTRFQGKVKGGIPFYKVSDMNLDGNERNMVHENNSITEEVRRKLGASLFPEGSVIFPKIGGAIATNKKRLTTRDCCVDNNIMGAIPKPGKVSSEFLYYFFLACNLSDFANEAHLPSIKKTVVEDWELCVPKTMPEQEYIVEQLDSFAKETQRLTRLYERKLAALEELKKSLLHQAFSGNL